MRKYLRNITVGAALLLLAGSCTDKFEEYNTNQYQIHDADPATLMKSMMELPALERANLDAAL